MPYPVSAPVPAPVPAPVLTPDDIAAALDATSSQWLPGSEITITLARFPGGSQDDTGRWYMSKYGDNVEVDFMTWEAARRAAAASPWPDESAKLSLPYEIGARLNTESTGKCRRRAQDVTAFTWIFVDSDGGQPATLLRERLQALNICFLLTESATSRSGDNPVKFHLFLPLATPKELPSRHLPGIDAVATLSAWKEWWHRIHRHVTACMFLLGGLAEDVVGTSTPRTDNQLGDDATASTLARLAYVPHCPAGAPPRHMVANEGRLLDLDGFLRATGFDDVEPPIVRVDMATSGKSASKTKRPSGDVTSSPPDEDDDGPTADETTGSLLFKALNFFGLVDPGKELEPGKRRALCPWRHEHTPSDTHDPEGFLPNDSSVVFWTRDEAAQPGGGWECSHHGNGIAGQCAQSTAADVLRWARKHGCPLPDKPAWGGRGRVEPEASATLPGNTSATAPECNAKAISQPTPSHPLTPHVPLPPAFPGAPAEGAPPTPPRPSSAAVAKQPAIEIEVTTDQITMRNLAIKAIANHGSFYNVDNMLFDLVEVAGEDRYGNQKRPWLRKTVAPHLTCELSAVSRWFTMQYKKGGAFQAYQTPDRSTVAQVLAVGVYPGVRELNGIITTPVFGRGPNYTLVQTPGYDASLGVLYRPVGYIPRVSINPSRQQLTKAKAEVLKLFADFPFRRGDEDTALAVLLAAMFTRFLRFTFVGNVPMFCVSAGAAGSGKGKLIDACAIISDGAESWKRTKAGDDAEVERAIGAAIKEEVAVAVLDNIARGDVLESPTLEAYLTTPVFTTREIGTSKNIKGVKGGWTDTLWWATGNGLQTGGDMSRRVLRIDIDDRTGRPEDRKVAIPELEKHCHANRAQLLGHMLTLLSGFFAAKKQGWSVVLPPFASFEAWSIVREAVVWCGLPDPILARGKATDDVDTGNFLFLVEHLQTLCGTDEVGVGDLVSRLQRDRASSKPQHAEVYNFFVEVCRIKLDSPSGAATSLGKFLEKFHGKATPDGRWQLMHYRTKKGGRVRVVATGETEVTNEPNK